MRGKIAALTGIRGIAASWVVLLHYNALFGALGLGASGPVATLIRSGYLAVDLFFLLSGFVLAGAYTRKRATYSALGLAGEFALNRVFRIMPLNTAALLLMLGLTSFLDYRYWTTVPPDAGSFVAALLLVQSWGLSSPTAWNLPAWSLSAEWLAYVTFPVLVMGAARVRSRALAGGACLLSLALLVLVMMRFGRATLDHTWLLGLPRCLLQFTAGICLWKWLSLATRPVASPDGLLAAGASLLLLAMIAPPLELLAPFAFSLVIVACASGGRWTDRLLGNRVIEFFGDISFSLYLVHFVLLGLFMLLARHWALAQAVVGIRIGYLVGAVLAAFAVSTLTWRFVELPGQRAGRYVKMKWLSRAVAARDPAAVSPESIGSAG